MPSDRPTLGTLLRSMRRRRDWTLKEMAGKSGIPVSTLSKIEHDRLSLSYDKLLSLSDRLGIKLSEFFSDMGGTSEPSDQKFTARRSLSDIDRALRVETQNYDYYYLSTDLRSKRMIPVITRVRAKSQKEFGDLCATRAKNSFTSLRAAWRSIRNTITLEVNQSMYVDSDMGHAYLAGKGCEEAVILAVMAGSGEDNMSSLMQLHETPV